MGDPLDAIPLERRQHLLELAAQQRAWVASAPDGQRNLEHSVFREVALNGQEVFLLAAVALAGHEAAWADIEVAGDRLRAVQRDDSDTWVEIPDLHLENAVLNVAQLAGAILSYAQLVGANLTGAQLDAKTTMTYAMLLEEEDPRTFWQRLLRRPRYGPALGDIRWGDFDLVQLSQLKGLRQVQRLVDERGLGPLSSRDDHEQAIRAYRQVAARLRDQGSNSDADRLSERAQICQRRLAFARLIQDWRRPWHLPGGLIAWLGSWFLALLAGYGYHPERAFVWYLATIFGFAFLFYQVTHGVSITRGLATHVVTSLGMAPFPKTTAPPMQGYEALVTSLVSFHGRGFFPMPSPADLFHLCAREPPRFPISPTLPAPA